MKLTPVMEKFVVHWGEMGARWGVNRSVAQIHALLYLSPAPLTADEIAETLSIARSNVSTSLRELQGWGLAQIAHVLGDRRDHFETRKDVWELVTTIIEERKKRELDPTIALLRQCVREAEDDPSTTRDVKGRLEQMLASVELMSGWYAELRTLPRQTLLRMMKLGAKVARFVSGGS